jgi:hypothetical protein
MNNARTAPHSRMLMVQRLACGDSAYLLRHEAIVE